MDKETSKLYVSFGMAMAVVCQILTKYLDYAMVSMPNILSGTYKFQIMEVSYSTTGHLGLG
jgi:hypothetical protein